MGGKFVIASDTRLEVLDWGKLGWLSNPPNTGAEQLTVIDVNLDPGKGHDFHKHPDQEEVIYVVEGEVEQWLEQNKRVLKPGDSVFIPADVVHASFNSSDKPVKLLATFAPCVTAAGFVSVEMGEQEPWKSLR